MEQNFQTSFIPKKPVIEERVATGRPISFFTIIAVFVLFTVLVATAGLYAYRGVLTRSIVNKENSLNLAKNRFEPSKITELQNLDRRLVASTEILADHVSVTPIFEALQDITMKTVRYTNFDYVLSSEPNAPVAVKLKGQAIGYRSIALQSDLFAGNEHLIDPVFSNLTLDEKGNVNFDLVFLVDRSFVDYKQNIEANTASTVPAEMPPVQN